MLNRLLVIVSVLLAALPSTILSAKILSVAFVSTKSHKITYEPLLYELAKRGHHVTVLAPHISGKTIPNVREILTIDVDESIGDMGNMFVMKENNENVDPFFMADYFGGICERIYDLPQVQQLAKEKFDLILLEGIFNECAAGYIHRFNTSLILISPVLTPPFVVSMFGNPSPPSFIPSMFTSFSDQMTFLERTLNLMAEAILRITWIWYVEPKMEAIYRAKLNDPNLPSSNEILRNASLILSNSHFSLSKPKPLLPDIVEVGGMHCNPAKPLPKDLDDFLNSSGSDGFIYFSMGSALNASLMQDKYRQVFLNTFAKLKQNVLWKWETEEMKGLPKNVKLSKWLPQQDVLGHPKIKMFISHGGFGGSTEAAYHGVPLIGIPMFGDQPLNIEKAAAAGYALNLDFVTLSSDKLLHAINRVLKEPKFRERVQHISRIFRDGPNHPLETAVFWVEYVLKHKGATHLRSAARNLNFIQYHSIDVIFTLALAVFLVLYLGFVILRLICVKLFCRGKSSKELKMFKHKKQN